MTEKKIRIKVPKENKVRAELQKEIGSVCPFCDNEEVGHFEIHHIDENPSNNDTGNLLLLCSTCHSKITKGDISQLETLKKKIELMKSPIVSKSAGQKVVNFNSKIKNAIVGDYNNVSINQAKPAKPKYPQGCVGFETTKANYIGHLVKRFNEYKEYEVGKGNVKYAVFSAHLKKQFKLAPTRTLYNLPIERFGELVDYIHLRINSTKLAKIKGHGHKNYSTFDEYSKEYG
ncbi:HNH endonuclease signature motif containing protein [Pedobacter arcticus]|uniref:HNH endonuclease signature motif containing protein n=1 Tax=Pedobacter arcticus TaxID=752140 RepID=UPI000307AC7A|nr:HNH endonuclease [Pedobacter arcticus]